MDVLHDGLIGQVLGGGHASLPRGLSADYQKDASLLPVRHRFEPLRNPSSGPLARRSLGGAWHTWTPLHSSARGEGALVQVSSTYNTNRERAPGVEQRDKTTQRQREGNKTKEQNPERTEQPQASSKRTKSTRPRTQEQARAGERAWHSRLDGRQENTLLYYAD